ncbi:ATP-dependent sacrificial sulfur transferase LarE [bacterium 1XD8-76]|nr:ATP-dependent sacrificial sulfur transferase LarE [bacterium 1XD8-76]
MRNFLEAEKYRMLREKMDSYVSGGIAVAFSGGVDSALLLKLACMAAGENTVYAVTVQTRLHPANDLETAKRMAVKFGAAHRVLQIDELAESGLENNPVDRCYLCKRSIFRKIKNLTHTLGVEHILEGTNADDLGEYRPGIRAVRELGISSPLAECGLTKAEIRELAGHLGISAAKRPSAPCLATRLPYGTKIDYALLGRIDEGERYLRELGFYNVRLRVHELTELVSEKREEQGSCCENGAGSAEEDPGREWLARIEVDLVDLGKLLENREELVEKIKELGFSRVTMDLEGFRSGSMDKV